MTDMIERVADAIMDQHDTLHSTFLDLARAAIKAMREPTAAMMQAGCASNPPGQYHADTKLSEIIGAEWQAMIDEALKEQ